MTYTPRTPGKGFKKKIAKLQAENDALRLQLAETEQALDEHAANAKKTEAENFRLQELVKAWSLYQVAINRDVIPVDCKESPGSFAAVAPAETPFPVACLCRLLIPSCNPTGCNLVLHAAVAGGLMPVGDTRTREELLTATKARIYELEGGAA